MIVHIGGFGRRLDTRLDLSRSQLDAWSVLSAKASRFGRRNCLSSDWPLPLRALWSISSF